jgi:hypothetical protein
MKQTTIRYSENIGQMLAEIDEKSTTAAQNVLELFGYLRRATLSEMKGKFTREEIIAMADAYNGTIPTWQYLANPGMFVAHMEDAEKFDGTCTRQKADPDKLIDKIGSLTSAQVAILQLELARFWNCEGPGGYGSPSPDLEKLVKFFV